MKTKITMLLSFILMTTASVFAQNYQRPSVEERVKGIMEKMAPLTLDAAQTTKTDSVFTQFYRMQNNMMDSIRATGERPDRSVFEKVMNDRDAKLKGIFTDAQYKKYKDEVEATLRPQRRSN
ncbi:MAG: hypothetical protein ACMG51_03985 [Ginsengibacter sp.]